MARMEGSTLTRPTPGHRFRAPEPRPGRARRPRSPSSSSRCSAWGSRSASSSSRRTRSTTRTTRCCGAAICCTATRWSSTASATRPSIRSRSPPARSCSSSAASGDRLWVAMILGLVPGAGRRASTGSAGSPRRRWSGAIAAVLLLTRFDYPFLAARGYVDIPYMALVVWAATLEATRPRRGVPVLILLALAGMLRPEAWFLAAMYWVLGGLEGDVARALPVRRAGRGRPGDVGGGRLPGHRRPALLAAVHDGLGRGSRAASARSRSCPRRSRASSRTSSSCRSSWPPASARCSGS